MEELRILQDEIDYYLGIFQKLTKDEKEHLKKLIEEKKKMEGSST